MNKETLDILVVEDKERHYVTLDSLRAEGHRVDIAKNLFEASKALGYARFGGESTKKYDAVLTDLMLPMGGRNENIVSLADESKRHEEAPVGYGIMLRAVKQGVPYVAIVTDLNHHQGAVAATFDMLHEEDKAYQPFTSFTMNASKIGIFDERGLPALYLKKDGTFAELTSAVLNDENARENYVKNEKGNFVQMKNWKAALDTITGKMPAK